MTAQLLPCRTDLAHYSMQLELDGAFYGVELRWNERAEAWMLSIRDKTDALLWGEQRVVVGFPLTSRSQNSAMPPGELVALDTTGANQDPGREDLGARVELYYLPAADLEELAP